MKAIRILIVGAGKGGSAVLRAFRNLAKVQVIAIVDVNEEAPGLRLARKMGIMTGRDFTDFLTNDVDMIIEATGKMDVYEEILEKKPPRAILIPGTVASLIMSLIDEKEALIHRLSLQRKELDVILNSTHDAMIAVNADGVITLFNAAAERLTGLKAHEVIGYLVRDKIPNSRLHIVLETGVPEINQLQVLHDNRIITNRVPVRDENGTIVGAVAVFRDVTEVLALAEEVTNLKEMRSMLEAIISSTHDAISVVDEKGHGILINPAYTRLTGLKEQDVIGKPATVDIAEGESMHLRVLKTQQPVRGVHMKVGPKRRDVIVNVAPIIVDGVLKGSVGVIHDMSEIKMLSDELDKAKQLIRTLQAKYTFDDIIGSSAEMVMALEQARIAANTSATVLLRGESGTGKELFAHAIHNASARKYKQFVRVNCAAISETLLESELFGYVEGAFTGARRGGKKGLFEEASGGTIFLDEIGELTMSTQAKILRVLQEKEIVRVGSSQAIPVNVRVIAATNVNLERAIQRGTFREDLYYRLNVLPIIIPSLRYRKEDIVPIAHKLIQKFNQEYGRNVEKLSEGAIARMMAYHWPGNVRELENVLGRAIINMQFTETVIEPHHLPDLPPERKKEDDSPSVQKEQIANEEHVCSRTLAEILEEVEQAHIRRVLKRTKGNKTEAAKILGIAIRSLYYKLEKYGIQNI
ncbi:sigma-54-dependent Fis family transcriptional regulator [Collibacillus ludicampi]|uniref:Sigma-54-dependent Fis family transcriptional regulator n=1 Tax=Collibacillus ludicampi TaxID=2771369 RepID=A0AAV4LKQ5_9BACL|nr:sigma-54-dependent Fis family transcriptional regulator [Collibacillus ludicampi]GIM48316.1 sigma-54-dependent Fis family transcriptional regulator [Collibacillus ludicampi]